MITPPEEVISGIENESRDADPDCVVNLCGNEEVNGEASGPEEIMTNNSGAIFEVKNKGERSSRVNLASLNLDESEVDDTVSYEKNKYVPLKYNSKTSGSTEHNLDSEINYWIGAARRSIMNTYKIGMQLKYRIEEASRTEYSPQGVNLKENH